MMVNSVHTVRVTTVDSKQGEEGGYRPQRPRFNNNAGVITGKVAVRVLPIIIPMRNIA